MDASTENASRNKPPRRVVHPTMASWSGVPPSSAAKGVKPAGLIELKVEYKGDFLDVSVLKGTVYTLCALRSRVKVAFSLAEFTLKYVNEDDQIVPVAYQVIFEKALKMGERTGVVHFKVVDKVKEVEEKRTPRRVQHPMMASWNRNLKAYDAVQGKKPEGQIQLKLDYKGKTMLVHVLKGTTYTLCALRSRINVRFGVTKMNLKYTDQENELVTVNTQALFEEALKMGEKTGVVYFQVVDKVDVEEEKPKPRRVHHPMMASWNKNLRAYDAVQGKKPEGQIQLKMEYEGRSIEMSVLKETTYSLCALRSRIKTRFFLEDFTLNYFDGNNDLVRVDTQVDFEKALKSGEITKMVHFEVIEKVGTVEYRGPRRVQHPMMASWNRNLLAYKALQGKKPEGQILLKLEYEGNSTERSVFKETTYSLCAIKSQMKVKFGLTNIGTQYVGEDGDLVSVDTQDEFEQALKVTEKLGGLTISITNKDILNSVLDEQEEDLPSEDEVLVAQ